VVATEVCSMFDVYAHGELSPSGLFIHFPSSSCDSCTNAPVATEGVTLVPYSYSTFYIYAPVSMHLKGTGVSQETVERLYQEFLETFEACTISKRVSNHSLYTTSHVECDRCLTTTIPGKFC
jgi:hypothetical protein